MVSRQDSSSRSASTSSDRRWRSLLAGTAICVLACSTGCASGPRVALVPNGNILRTGPDMRGRVYIEDENGEWVLSGNSVQVPEGWYLVDHPGTLR